MGECLHPRTVHNKYTGQLISVKCGVCPACIASRASSQFSKLTNFAANFKYQFFSTLTYSEEMLSSFELIRLEDDFSVFEGERPHSSTMESSLSWLDGDDSDSVLVGFRSIPRDIKVATSLTSRRCTFIKTDYYEFTKVLNLGEVRQLIIKSNSRYDYTRKAVVSPPLSECIPYIHYFSADDFQLFMKRLRIKISRTKSCCDEKVLYYAVQEYGPRTLRPHWHVLFFFNSEELSKVFSEYCSKAWPLGNCDTELSRGYCANYVASYVNSTVSLPPLFHSHAAFRPKTRHSKGIVSNLQFPQTFYVSEVDEASSLCIDGRTVSLDGKISVVHPTSSYISRLFLRFSDVLFKSPRKVYNLIINAVNAPFRCLKSGFGTLSSNPFGDGERTSLLGFVREYASFLVHLLKTHTVHEADKYILIATSSSLGNALDFDAFVGRLYRFFRRIKLFLASWRLSPGSLRFCNDLHTLCSYIPRFYSRMSLNTLKSQYEFQETCPLNVLNYIQYRTIGFLSDKKQSDPYFNEARSVTSNIKSFFTRKLLNKIKHKEYNDSLGLLLT